MEITIFCQKLMRVDCSGATGIIGSPAVAPPSADTATAGPEEGVAGDGAAEGVTVLHSPSYKVVALSAPSMQELP